MKTVDMHCDTISGLYQKKKADIPETLKNNNGHVDLRRMKKADYLLQNFAIFVNMGKTAAPMLDALSMIDFFYAQLEYCKSEMTPVFTWEDIERNRKDGKLSALLTLEEGGVCGGSISMLRNFYRLGVRMMTLTWNYPNEIGFPNIDSSRMSGMDTEALSGQEEPFFLKADMKNGLTKKGVEFVKEMERIGMIIDVSHLSDAGFYDVLRETKKPFAASHSNARDICGWVRNMTDDMIYRLAERGGVIGLNFCPEFLTYPLDSSGGTIDAIVRHAKHIVRIGGIDCLGLGGDFDGIDGHAQLKDCSGLPLLDEALRHAGFTFGEREKIFSENVLRLYREVL